MKTMLFAVTILGFVAACSEGTASQETSAPAQKTGVPSKLSECVKAAGITTGFSVETVVAGNQTIKTIPARNGVTEAQAKKANSCLAG